MPALSSSQDISNWREEWADGKCPHCAGVFKGAQGVRVHISNAHRQQSQELKLRRRERRGLQTNNLSSSVNNTAPTKRTDINLSQIVDTSDGEVPSPALLPSVIPWETVFSEFLERPDSDDFTDEFREQVEKCADFLHLVVQDLKGPKHPNTRFYEARRARRLDKNRAGHHRTSNPSRRDKRRRNAARERYQYDLVQYQYYNTRRQAVRSVLGSKNKRILELEEHFVSTLENPNNMTRDEYGSECPNTNGFEDEPEDISEEEIKNAMKGMAIDTSPGHDKVLLRVIKTLKCEKLLSLIATLMYRRTIVPPTFQQGRTVLLAKDGDPNLLKNWRPITIFSVLRRIIERVLDRRLRKKALLSNHQRGFVSVPGTHLNSSIVNEVMRSARKNRKSCVIVFLDVSKAFDNIGHTHVRRTLESLALPDRLRHLICKLCEEKFTTVCAGSNTTRRIEIRRGVPQGAPLSPALFNLCIDFLLKELTDEQVARQYGYTLDDSLTPLSAMAFADDIVLLAKDVESARRLVDQATKGLQTIGLNINSCKSQAVVFAEGRLTHLSSGLPLLDGSSIPTLGVGERVRYLGVDFEDEIVLDEAKTLRQLKENVDLLANTSLLHPDQKLNILNTFVWPTLVYPLQTAPIYKIHNGFLDDVDALLRGAVKQFCGLPMDTPNSMVYSSQKHRGLGVVRASWEAFLQHINIVRKLERLDDPYLPHCRNLVTEESECLRKLDFSEGDIYQLNEDRDEASPTDMRRSVRELRTTLRDREFSNWCSLPSKGLGVELFAETSTCNKWVRNRSGLSTSEWTNAIKMSTNGCNLRSNPRTTSDTSRCRHCSEFESLAHVLGKCPRGELLRIRRHHQVCDTIATELRQRGCTVLREDHVTTGNLGSRFTDLVVLDSRDSIKKGYILDPTIRFEKSSTQACEVDEEKTSTYESTLSSYKQRFPDISNWEVMGLLFGARGAIPLFTADVLTKKLRLPKGLLPELALNIMKDSLGILHHHMYSRTGD